MDGTKPGEAGVLAWCNSIRLSIAEDDGRERLDTQIQKHGFDFLDSYLESVFSRPKEECVPSSHGRVWRLIQLTATYTSS